MARGEAATGRRVNQLTGDALSGDVRAMIRLLNVHEVEYLLVGGHAVVFHGYPRMTRDADFYFRCSKENAGRLYAALREFWDGPVPGIAVSDALAEPNLVVQFGRPPNRIDLITSPAGLDFASAWSRRVHARLPDPRGDLDVPILGLTDLRVNKAAAGRPRDLDDLANLPLPPRDAGRRRRPP